MEAEEEVKREWHWKEEKAARGGYLVERRERGWIERRGEEWRAVSLVTCGYCGESGENEGGNFVRLDSIHDMWCQECERYKDRLDREVRQGRKFKNKCDICAWKWVGAEKYKGICKICNEEGKKGKTPKAKLQPAEKKEERDLRRTLRPLNEVWMTIGMEKVETHEGITVKALLDSRATGMFADRKFVEKNGFKLEKMERAVRIKNVDGTENSGGMVTHEIECNVYYKGHVEQMRLDV